MLKTERNADDRHTEHDSKSQMGEGYLDSAEDDPDDVHAHRQTSAVLRTCLHLMPERPEGESGHLHQLKTERNTDHCQAEQEPEQEIVECDKKSSKKDPDDVSK